MRPVPSGLLVEGLSINTKYAKCLLTLLPGFCKPQETEKVTAMHLNKLSLSTPGA